MKIEVDVLGIEQSVNFDTMATSNVVVLEVLGTIQRVPITEEQMEALTINAAKAHAGYAADFEETREKTPEGVQQTTERVAEQPVREFSVMAELTDLPPAAEDVPNEMMAGIFGDEEAKIEELRKRTPPARPVAQAPTQGSMPRLPGMGAIQDDDGFQQG